MRLMIKKLFSFFILLLILLGLTGCSSKISDEEVDAELQKLSGPELNTIITETEGEGALAGQVYRFSKISAPRKQVYARAILERQNRNVNQLSDSVPITEQKKAPLTSLKSDFFKDNPIAKKINENGESYDLGKENLQVANENNYYNYNKDTFAFKLLNGFLMLGYNQLEAPSAISSYRHLDYLHEFQEKNGFKQSNFLSKQMLLKMDQLLAEREIIYKKYAAKFPLFNRIAPLHPNDVSKEFVATLFELPNSVLPSNLQLKTEQDWYKYFYYQGGLVGLIHSPEVNPFAGTEGGYDTKEPPFESNWVFSERFYNSYDCEVFDQPHNEREHVTSRFSMIMHEYGHYLDLKYPQPFYYEDKEDEIDFSKKPYVDSRDFKDITFIVPDDLPPYTQECLLLREDATPYDFIEYRSMVMAIPPCGKQSLKSNPTESFATFFSAYVINGKQFRDAAKKNEKIAQKYNWLKDNVFEGIEYDTDLLAGGGVSGCQEQTNPTKTNKILNGYEITRDMPGYLKCDDGDFVWDGKLEVLKEAQRQPSQKMVIS